jgi:hypothetical protein
MGILGAHLQFRRILFGNLSWVFTMEVAQDSVAIGKNDVRK